MADLLNLVDSFVVPNVDLTELRITEDIGFIDPDLNLLHPCNYLWPHQKFQPVFFWQLSSPTKIPTIDVLKEIRQLHHRPCGFLSLLLLCHHQSVAEKIKRRFIVAAGYYGYTITNHCSILATTYLGWFEQKPLALRLAPYWDAWPPGTIFITQEDGKEH